MKIDNKIKVLDFCKKEIKKLFENFTYLFVNIYASNTASQQ